MRTEIALASALGERYALHEVVGQGGMATVYRASDRQHGRDVAVKVLRDDGGGEFAVDRFRREIETAARLTHPHILPVHDSGATDALRWYVMPLVRGPSLRRRMEQQPLAPHESLRIAQQVAEALAYAHAHGVVHRDVKPENILLEEGHAVLADFGVARLVDDARPASWTRTGHVVGTPAYMSPEQGTGELPVSGAADVYALGCVLHEMLAGAPPFGSGPHALVMMRHVNDAPPTLAHRTGIAPAVADFVRRCLDKEPARRPTAQDASRELDQLRTASRSGAMVPVSRRSRWGRVAIVVALVGGAALVGADWVRSGRLAGAGVRDAQAAAPTPGWIVLGEFESDGGDSLLARGVRDLLEASLASSTVARSPSMSQLRGVARAAGWDDSVHITADRAMELAKRYGVRAAVAGSLGSLGPDVVTLTARVLAAESGDPLATLAERGPRDSLMMLVDRLARRLRTALDERPEVLRKARPVFDAATPSLPAFEEYARAIEAARTGKLDESNQLLRRAVTIDTAFAAAWLALASNAISLGDRASALRHLARARAFPTRLSEPQRARLEAELAMQFDGDAERALALYDALVAADTTAIAARTNRGLLRLRLGDAAGALADYAAAYRANPFVPATGQISLVNELFALVALGRADSARRLLPLMGDRWRPFALLAIPLAARDAAAAGRVADSLVRARTDEGVVAPLLPVAQAAGACGAGRWRDADSLLAAATRASTGSAARWYAQQRLVLATLAPGARAMPTPLDDGGSATFAFVQALLLDGPRRAAALAPAVLAQSEAERRRAGQGVALARAAQVASADARAGAAAFETVARAGDPGDDPRVDRPVDAVAIAAAAAQWRAVGDSARAMALVRELALRARTSATQVPMHLCLRAVGRR